MSRTARVVTASNRAAAGVYADATGPVIVEWLRGRGYDVPDAEVVPDGDPVAAALRAAVAAGADVVVTTGGTGVTPTDRTPEATRAVLDYEIPGIADAIRSAGLPGVPTAVLSRGLAGVAGRTLVVNLPGSRGGVKDGLRVLEGVLDHAVDQLHGGDHPRPPADQPTAPLADQPPTGQPAGEPADQPATGQPAGPPPAPPSGGQTGGGQAAAEQSAAGRPEARVLRAEVTGAPIDVESHAALVGDAAAGAVVTFAGVVRDHDHGRGVTALDYEGHPSADAVIAEVAAEVAARHGGVRALAVSHRIGRLAIGDTALACAVSADHRRAAFTACADLVDEVKARLPIWKHQRFTDGTDEWVNCP